jgi:histidine triad (HIT) family protein
VIAFRDINPAAPVHLLVVPKDHYPDIRSLVRVAPSLVVDLTRTAAEVAETAGIEDFRLVFNTGAMAGQSVFHVHGHVLGGRKLGWPPG